MRKQWWPASAPARPSPLEPRSAPRSEQEPFATPTAKGNPPRSIRSSLLPGALAISLGLVGIDFAHSFQKLFNVRLVHFRRARPFATASGARAGRTLFLRLIRHSFP